MPRSTACWPKSAGGSPCGGGGMAKKGGGGKGGSVSIDPWAMGRAQTETNVETARTQAALNNINTISPIGTSTYTPYTDPATGQTRYTLQQALSEPMARLFDPQVTGAQSLANLIPYLRGQATDLIGQGAQHFSQRA